VISIIPV
uniref:Colutellin-A (Fragments) n=1 Tax=Colletotrichum dematium TaxID=34405 RepID=COLUA_COLDE|nr:RecName: Full=Colutellin-A [Colletotrichum dematium]